MDSLSLFRFGMDSSKEVLRSILMYLDSRYNRYGNCRTIQNFFFSPALQGRTALKMSQLKICAASHCSICDMFLRALKPQLRRGATYPEDVQLICLEFEREVRVLILRHMASNANLSSFKIILHPTDPAQFEELERLRRLRTNVSKRSDSAACFAMISEWLHECDQTHAFCKNTGKSLPSRLLDVSTSRIRLVEAGGRSGRYVALSHCWGHSPVLKTTKDTLSARTKVIREYSLSKVYRNAVTIARRLSIPYLWIDSLCIIQGDNLDWEVESANMANVYGNAYLVIAADLSPDGAYGIFSKREHGISEAKNRHRNHASLSKITLTPFWGHSASTLISSDDLQPLLRRAWAFQERVLASRVLHYTRQEIVFECRTHTLCECKRKGLSKSSKSRPSLLQDLHSAFDTEDAEVRKRCWIYMVRLFSQGNISFEQDKLVAMSGLASKISHPSLGRYLAGLWENDLYKGLMWYTETSRRRSEEYVAPSWSWASVSTPVKHFYTSLPISFSRSSHRMAHIGHVDTDLAGSNPYGMVNGGKLKVHGHCLLISDDNISLQGHGVEFYRDIPKLEGPDLSEELTYLVLSYNDAARHYLDYRNDYLCLALKQAERQTGLYERIGLAYISTMRSLPTRKEDLIII